MPAINLETATHRLRVVYPFVLRLQICSVRVLVLLDFVKLLTNAILQLILCVSAILALITIVYVTIRADNAILNVIQQQT